MTYTLRRRRRTGHASIKDVADRAGVSTATVSHVINGTRNTLPETRERVLTAVRELGYSLNQAARNLVVGHSSLLGLIVTDVRNPFFPEVTAAFQEEALGHQMDALVMNTNSELERALDSVRRLIGLQVPGVAVLTPHLDPSVGDLLSQRKIQAVYLDQGRVGPGVSNLTIDYEKGVSQAVEHLVRLGHRSVGYLGGPANLTPAQRRRQAFLDGAARASLTLVGMVDGPFSVEGGYEACRTLLTQHRPTAIVAGSDLMAVGALHGAMDRGIAVPEELSIVGFDNITFSEYTRPSLTTVDLGRDEIGRMAFRALWEMISDREQPGREYRIETRLVERKSTAAPPNGNSTSDYSANA
jgi:LacI family transcriptional regulator